MSSNMFHHSVGIITIALSLFSTIELTEANRGKNKDGKKFFIYDFPGESYGWVGDGNWLKTSSYYHGYGNY